MFKRKITSALERWKNRQGRTALLVEGPYDVGKTTAVTEFARHAYRRHILINFSDCSESVRRLFDDTHDLDFFFLQLQTLTGVTLETRHSVIIFDRNVGLTCDFSRRSSRPGSEGTSCCKISNS